MIKQHKRKYLMWMALALLFGNGGMGGFVYYAGMHPEEAVEKAHDPALASIGLIHEEGVEVDAVAAKPGKVVVDEHAPAPTTPVVKAPVDPLVCYEIGPFESSGKSKPVRKALKGKGLAISLEFRQKEIELGHWVYLPPERSLALARLKEEELKTKGLKDVMLVVKSKPKYAISLGVFKQKEIAEQRLAEVQSLGYDAKMEIRHQSDNEAWINVQTKQSQDLPPNEWLALLEGLEKVELKTVECPSTN